MKINEVVSSKKYNGIITEGIFYNENVLKEQLIYEGFLDSASQYLGSRINDTIADITGNITDMRTAGVLIKDVIQNPAYLEKVNTQLLKTCNGYIKQINRLSLSNGLIKSIWEKISSSVSNLIRAIGWKGFLGRLGVAGLLKYILVNTNRLQSNILETIVEGIVDLENIISSITMVAFFNIFEGIAIIKKYFLDILTDIKNKLEFGKNIGMKESLLTERRQQRTGIYYHGTSTTFLKSILKHGLLKNPPKRVYSDDGISDVGQRTFPNAVYLTNDYDTALEASIWAHVTFGGSPMILEVQYVYNSGEMDEDVFTFKLTQFLRQTDSKEDFVKIFMKQFAGMKYNETIVKKLVEKLYDIIIAFMKENNIQKSKFSSLPNGDIINVIRLHPPYEEVVTELLRRVNPKKAETVRVPRDIGFSGKTKILTIFNPETDEILYPVEKITLNYLLTGIQTNSNVKPDTKYFMYGDYQEYIWGIGTNIKDTILDAAKELAKSYGYDIKNAKDMNLFRDEWNAERENCQIYAMDEEAYNKAKENAFFVMDKNEKGEITISQHDRSKRKNESVNTMKLNEIILEETYDGNAFFESYGYIPQILEEAEYQGRKVTLNKPVRSSDGPKKFHVYVKNDKGNIVKVNFGDPDMKIKKNIPARKKSFRARHHCDTDPGPKWKARYWACKSW